MPVNMGSTHMPPGAWEYRAFLQDDRRGTRTDVPVEELVVPEREVCPGNNSRVSASAATASRQSITWSVKKVSAMAPARRLVGPESRSRVRPLNPTQSDFRS